ncbi:MAG: hydroxyacid dehydrogenase [Aestuariivirga sp.]
MPHILVAGRIHEQGLEVLKNAKGVTFEVVDDVSRESYVPLLPKADALLIRTQPLDQPAIADAPNLKIVSRHGVGYDAVDVEALNARKIPLCIVGDVNSRAVAEHTLMLMLSAARRVVAHDQALRAGNWKIRNTFETIELDGKTLLVMGFGRIGKRVAALAQAFGMKVLGLDPMISADAMKDLNITPAADLPSALKIADYVTLHVPLIGGKPVIGTEELSLMKSTAILINAARGGLIDEAALDQALLSRKLYGAGLDVFGVEPPKAESPLLANPYVTLSPHSAGLTAECAARMGVSSAQNILDFFAGKLDANLVVNAKVIGF